MAEPPRPQSLTDEQILRSVELTVRDVLLPAIPEEEAWARAVAVQLVGLVRYAIGRGEDRTEARVAELAEVLAAMADNEIVAASWDGERSQRSVMAATGAALVASIDRHDRAAAAVRRELRPVVARQLDDELASTAPLVDAFRGRLDE
jgi:hypothetical protein